VDFLLVDGGSFSHRSSNNFPQTVATWTEMARLGYDAVTFGVNEIGAWLETDSLRTHLDLPVVCTNLEQQQGDAWVPIGERYRIVECNGVKVGIMSVVNDIILSETVRQKSGDLVRVLPAEETTREVSRELREKCDLVVLLAYLDPGSMEAYAQEFETVDIILGGHNTRKDEGPRRYGHAIVNRAGTRGQYMSNTRIVITPENEIDDFGGINIALSTDIPEDPDVLAAVERAEAEMEARRRGARRTPPISTDRGVLPVAPGVHRMPLPDPRGEQE